VKVPRFPQIAGRRVINTMIASVLSISSPALRQIIVLSVVLAISTMVAACGPSAHAAPNGGLTKAGTFSIPWGHTHPDGVPGDTEETPTVTSRATP